MVHHHHTKRDNLKIPFLLNLAFTCIEVVAGLLTNSVAILSDAVHDFGDSLSLGIAWYLDKKSQQEATSKYSFGYARFSLMGAFITSLMLVISSVFIVFKAIERLQVPEPANGEGMMWFALLGIAVNGYAAWRLHGAKTLNEKVISWHLIEDVLGWVAVLIVGIVLQFYDAPYLDPLLSLCITVYILWNVFKRLKETTYLFLQGTPLEVDTSEIESALLTIPEIASVHRTHVWSLEVENHVFSSHVKLQNVNNLDELRQVKNRIFDVLQPYNFSHCTVETELDGEPCMMEDV